MKKRNVLLVILFFLIFLTCGLIFLKFNYSSTFETKKEKLKNKIDEINAETDKYYNKSLNSNMDSDECKENADIYSHSESTSSIISTYNNDEL